MGKSSKGAIGGAASGAAAGSTLGPWGALGGAVLGGIAGNNTDSGAPQQVQQVDPAFMNHLYNQSLGTEPTAADAKMKASFNQTLAQQVAAARAANGVNPGLLQQNVSRMAAEQAANAAQIGEQENLRSQDDARGRYLQAIGMNQNADYRNSQAGMAAEERDSKRTGALINGLAGAGAVFATADAAKDAANKNNNTPSAPATSPNKYSLGANTSINVPSYNLGAQSDKNSKTKIQKITAKANNDLVVTSDERQKDLIKNESLPTPQMQQQQQAPQPMQTPMMAAQNVTPAPQQAAPAPQQAPMQPAAQPPAPVPASQTALAQANASLNKGGRIDDLSLNDTSQLVKPADGPSAQDILAMSTDAQRRQSRDIFGNVTQSDAENYQANLGRWYAQQASQRADYTKQLGQANLDNANINNERSARLAKFYTGVSAANSNDLAQRYAPTVITPNADWQSAQQQQARLGISDLSAGHGVQVDNSPEAIARQQAAYNRGSQLLATSDENQKQSVQHESAPDAGKDSMSPKDFLDKLTAYSYEYKQGQKQNPDAGAGRYLSPMAQDLEKAGPVGQSMVKQDENGVKQVDYGKGFGAILASQIQLNERLKAIESKKGKR